jgi:hypothetical protein
MENNQSLPEYVWVVTAHFTHTEPTMGVYAKEKRAIEMYNDWTKQAEDSTRVTIKKCFLFTL